MTTLPALLLAAAGVGFGHAVMPDHWAPLAVLGRARRYPLSKVLRQSTAAAFGHVALSLLLGAVLIGVGLRFRAAVQGHEDSIVGGLLLATGAGLLVHGLRERGRGHSHGHGDGHGHGHGGRHDHNGGHDHGREHRHGPDHGGDHGGGHSGGHGGDHGGGHGGGYGGGYGGDHGGEHGRGHGGEHGGGHGDGHNGGHERGASRRGRSDLAALVVPFGAAASPDLTILPVFLAASAAGTGAAVGSVLVFAFVTIGTIVGLTLLAAVGMRTLTAAWADRGANLLAAATLLAVGSLVAAGVI